MARTHWGPEETGAHLFSLPGQGSADHGPAVGSQSPATGERRREWVSSDNWQSVWTLCYMTLGCHYVKWQWYSSRVMTMMRLWPRSSDIRDVIMSDRRSSILDMIRGRGKEAARRQERDAPGLERWVLGSEDLRAAIESHLCILINSDVWEKTPDTDNQQLQHLRPLFVHLFLWMLMQRPSPGSQACLVARSWKTVLMCSEQQKGQSI